MSKKVAIVQSNYIPWKGYFDMIDRVDEFILFDEMQYTKRDWRNRNRIKTPHGLKWLTIPVQVSGKFDQRINETCIADPQWKDTHWKTLRHVYSKAPYFDTYAGQIESLYKTANYKKLSDINFHFIKGINEILNIQTEITWSSDYELSGDKTTRLVSLCKQANASAYLTGPAAKNYLEINAFKEEGIEVQWMDYSGYKKYPQLYNEFEHHVSILDLIFCVGEDARYYFKSQ